CWASMPSCGWQRAALWYTRHSGDLILSPNPRTTLRDLREGFLYDFRSLHRASWGTRRHAGQDAWGISERHSGTADPSGQLPDEPGVSDCDLRLAGSPSVFEIAAMGHVALLGDSIFDNARYVP